MHTESVPEQPGYSVRITKSHVLGVYTGDVLLNGEKVGAVPVFGNYVGTTRTSGGAGRLAFER